MFLGSDWVGVLRGSQRLTPVLPPPTSLFSIFSSSSSRPGRRGNPSPGGGNHRSGFGRIWPRTYTASPGCHPGDSASSLDPGAAVSSPHPGKVPSSLHSVCSAAWVLNVGNYTYCVSSRYILSHFCTPCLAVEDAAGEAEPAGEAAPAGEVEHAAEAEPAVGAEHVGEAEHGADAAAYPASCLASCAGPSPGAAR